MFKPSCLKFWCSTHGSFRCYLVTINRGCETTQNDHFGGLSPKSSKCSSPFLYMSGLNSINPHVFQLFSHPQWVVFPPLPCADSAPAPAQLPPWPWHPPLAAPASRAPPRPRQGCQQRSGGGWWGAPGVGDLSLMFADRCMRFIKRCWGCYVSDFYIRSIEMFWICFIGIIHICLDCSWGLPTFWCFFHGIYQQS